jgi:hypothetical protein
VVGFPPILGFHFFNYDVSSPEVFEYVYLHFYDHLCAATSGFLHVRNIPDDHPAVEILHDLETTAYHVDESLSGYIIMRRIIQAILKWADMLNCRLKVCYALCTVVSLF